MAKTQLVEHEISVKLPDQQWKFWENRAKELVKWYIINDMFKAIDTQGKKKSRGTQFSLQGMVSAGTVTDKNIEESKKIWQPKTSP